MATLAIMMVTNKLREHSLTAHDNSYALLEENEA